MVRNLIGSDVYISERLYDQKFAARGIDSSVSDGESSTLTWNAMLAKLKGSDGEQASMRIGWVRNRRW